MSATKQRAREPALPRGRRTTSSPAPINSTDQTELLRTLKEVFNELSVVEDVLIVCAMAYRATKTEQDGEVANVLRRCGSDPLFTQLQRLGDVVKRLGGKTSMTDDSGDSE